MCFSGAFSFLQCVSCVFCFLFLVCDMMEGRWFSSKCLLFVMILLSIKYNVGFVCFHLFIYLFFHSGGFVKNMGGFGGVGSGQGFG